MKRLTEKCDRCFATCLLLYLVQYKAVTSVARGEQVLHGVTLITNQTLNLSQWLQHLDVHVVTVPKGNLSFHDVIEATQEVLRAMHGEKNTTRAVIGSGDTIIDGLIARTIGPIEVPFISISKDGNDQLNLNLIPPLTDRDHVVTDLAVELGCQHIAVFSRNQLATTTLQQVRPTASQHGISFKIVQLFSNATPLTFVQLADQVYQMRNYKSILVVLDCTEKEAKYLIDMSKMISVRTVHFYWLVLQDINHLSYRVDLLPPGVIGMRSIFDERNWVHDALSLVNRSLHGCGVCSNPQLYSQMLRQKFRGKTGWIQFNAEGNRLGASYDIVRTSLDTISSNSTPSWMRVGSAEGFKVSLGKSFWTDHVQDQRSFLRVVVIEEEPMLIVSKHRIARDEECVLSYPCIHYAKYDNHSKRIQPVKCCCIGYLMDILNWLIKDASIDVELYLVADGKFGSYDPASKQWDGIIAELLSNKSDMALTTLTMTSIRANFVDFSYPFFYGETKLLISLDTSLAHGTLGFLAPFDFLLWIMFLVSVNTVLGVVWALERSSPYGHRRTFHRRNNRFSIIACMSYVWSNVVKLELECMKPQSSSARFTTAVFSFCTLIIMTSYTANLAASLVQVKDDFPVSGIEDPKFQNPPPGFKFTTLHSSGTLSHFTNSDDVAYRRIGRNMLPHLVKNYTEGLEKLKNGDLDAFIYDSPFIDLGASKIPGCLFKVVGNPIITKAYAVAFPKESKWKDPVTNLLLKYQRKDYFRKLKDKWFKGSCLHSEGSPKSAYKMKPKYLRGLLLICCGAVATCFVILFGEYLWSRRKRKQGKYCTQQTGLGKPV